MPLAQNKRVRAIGSAVATAAIPAVVLGSLAIPAEAAPLPTRDLLAPKAATPAMMKAAEARISAHLVASHVPTSVTQVAKKTGTVTVKKNDTLSHISVRTGVSVSELKKANKLSSDRIYPGQVLRLGGGSTASAPKASSGKAAVSTAKAAQTYKVVGGDVMGAIAQKLGVGLDDVRRAAGNPARDTIYVGQVLRFGSTGTSTASKAAPKSGSGSAQGSYTVKAGDNPSMIAIRHNMSVSAFMRLNNLSNGDIIMPGDKLKTSGSSSAPAAPRSTGKAPAAPKTATGGSYTVASGDTLGHISAKTGTPMNTLLKLNPGLTYSTVLQIGRTLKVNGSGNAAPQSSSSVNPTASKPLVGNTFLGRTYKSDVVRSANENKAELLSRNLPSRAAMQTMIANTARQMGVDPSLALAHAFQESSFNMNAVSPANAVGAMQVIPSAGQWAEGLVGRKLDLLNPQDNVTAGVAIIRAHQRSAPSVDLGIAYYYQGATGVQRNGMYADTKNYVAQIKAHQKKFS